MKPLLILLAGSGLAAFFLWWKFRAQSVDGTDFGPSDADPETHFVFAKILDAVLPMDRGEKYEDPLWDALAEMKYGEVTGAGTSVKDGEPIYVGIDLQLVNLDEALEFTRAKLLELGAPPGSVLQYEKDGKQFELPIHP